MTEALAKALYEAYRQVGPLFDWPEVAPWEDLAEPVQRKLVEIVWQVVDQLELKIKGDWNW